MDNSDSNFKNIDSYLNNKCNIDTKPSLILHTTLDTSESLPTKIDRSLIKLTQDIRKNIMDTKTDFDNFIREHVNTSLHTTSYKEINTNVQKQTHITQKKNLIIIIKKKQV